MRGQATYGLRILPTYPWNPHHIGRVIAARGDYEQVQRWAALSPNAAHLEIVELDQVDAKDLIGRYMPDGDR